MLCYQRFRLKLRHWCPGSSRTTWPSWPRLWIPDCQRSHYHATEYVHVQLESNPIRHMTHTALHTFVGDSVPMNSSTSTHLTFVHIAKLCLSVVICSGDDVRRYMSGPPGPQGPPGPPGASGGISGTYNIQEIATYVFNIMNGRLRLRRKH